MRKCLKLKESWARFTVGTDITRTFESNYTDFPLMNVYLCYPGCKITYLKNRSTFWSPKMHSCLYVLCCSFEVGLHSYWYIKELIFPCLDVWSCINRFLFNKPFVSRSFVAQGLILACHTLRNILLWVRKQQGFCLSGMQREWSQSLQKINTGPCALSLLWFWRWHLVCLITNTRHF